MPYGPDQLDVEMSGEDFISAPVHMQHKYDAVLPLFNAAKRIKLLCKGPSIIFTSVHRVLFLQPLPYPKAYYKYVLIG